jgi:Fic family protein
MPSGQGLPRSATRSGAYEVFLPDRINGRVFLFDGDVARRIAEAEADLTLLDNTASTLAATENIARLLLRAESMASSRIEGLKIAPDQLLRADIVRKLGESSGNVTADEVLANVDAMAFAVSTIDQGRVISLEHIHEAHRRLLAGSPLAKYAGRLRTQQNWIGSNQYSPINAVFVPPPPDLVEGLMDDLVDFCNTDDLPPVAQAALAHAQFETIHPYVDGNGRIGRALIQMIFRRRGLAQRVVPPVSLVLATRTRDYIEGLAATRYVGDPESPQSQRAVSRWIGSFADVCSRAVSDAMHFEKRIDALRVAWISRVGPVRSDATVAALLSALPGAPLLTVQGAAELTQRSVQSVNEAVAKLVKANVLRQITVGRRNRAFVASEVLDAFVGLERQLASPAGDTLLEAPTRPVPRLPKPGRA